MKSSTLIIAENAFENSFKSTKKDFIRYSDSFLSAIAKKEDAGEKLTMSEKIEKEFINIATGIRFKNDEEFSKMCEAVLALKLN